MIKAVIIDDEPSAVRVLKLMLEKHVPEIKNIYTATAPQQALQLIRDISPQLIFLDVEMPLMNGFELLENFPKHNFDVIFITAFDNYALKAIKFSALDYLLKPIDADELKIAVAKFFEKRTEKQNQKLLLENFVYNLNNSETNSYRLAVATTEGTYFYNPEDIVRCEAVGNYTKIFLINKKPVITTRTLKDYEELLLSKKFLRVHRTHLVNSRYVDYHSRDHELKMTDGSAVQVSRRKWDVIKNQLEALKS